MIMFAVIWIHGIFFWSEGYMGFNDGVYGVLRRQRLDLADKKKEKEYINIIICVELYSNSA